MLDSQLTVCIPGPTEALKNMMTRPTSMCEEFSHCATAGVACPIWISVPAVFPGLLLYLVGPMHYHLYPSVCPKAILGSLHYCILLSYSPKATRDNDFY